MRIDGFLPGITTADYVTSARPCSVAWARPTGQRTVFIFNSSVFQSAKQPLCSWSSLLEAKLALCILGSRYPLFISTSAFIKCRSIPLLLNDIYLVYKTRGILSPFYILKNGIYAETIKSSAFLSGIGWQAGVESEFRVHRLTNPDQG